MTRQTSLQLTPQMERQLEALKKAGFGGNTDVFRLALDRMYNQEVERITHSPARRHKSGQKGSP